MQKCVSIVALLAVGASAQFTTQCVVDVGLGAFELVKVGLAINSAVTDCGADGTAAPCTADIGKVVAGMGNALGYSSEAHSSCGGPSTQCGTDVVFGLGAIGSALQSAGDAATTCANGQQALCVADVLSAGSSVAVSVSYFEAALASCGDAALPPASTPCGRSLVALRRDVAGALPPHSTRSSLIAQHTNATQATCGTCFATAEFNTAVTKNDWTSALTYIVKAGALC